MQNQKQKNCFIELGYAIQVHGIRGALLFELHNKEDSVLKIGLSLKLLPSGPKSLLPHDGQIVEVETVNLGPKAIVKLKGLDDRDKAVSWLPFKVMVERSALPAPKEGSYYLADLVGLPCFDQANGNLIGKIIATTSNGPQVIVQIEKEGIMDAGEILEIPLVPVFFPKVDPSEGKLVIVLPEYID